MPTQVDIHHTFRKRTKTLGRKYPSITDDVRHLLSRLENDERPGQKVPNVGYTVYKVRLPNRSARRGKSGGFRVIYYWQFIDHVKLLTIYSKTERIDISASEIRRLVIEAEEELE